VREGEKEEEGEKEKKKKTSDKPAASTIFFFSSHSRKKNDGQQIERSSFFPRTWPWLLRKYVVGHACHSQKHHKREREKKKTDRLLNGSPAKRDRRQSVYTATMATFKLRSQPSSRERRLNLFRL
jgi:hypothetical protein